MKKKRLRFLILSVLILLFLITIGNFIFRSPNTFLSEDETIYNFYIRLYSETGDVYYFESLNSVVSGFVNPSLLTIADDSRILPRGFLGIIVVYGSIFSFVNLPIITVVISSLGLLVFYIFVRYLFNSHVSLISVFLLVTLPQYIYHSNLYLQNNVPAIVFLLYGLFYYLKAFNDKLNKHFILGSLFTSISVGFRYEYFIMFLFILLISSVKYFRKSILFDRKNILIGGIVFLLFISPILILNNTLYGSFYKIGETAYRDIYLNEYISPSENIASIYSILDTLITNLSTYFLNLYLLQKLYIIFCIFGFISLIKVPPNRITKTYYSLLIFITVYIVLLYGTSKGYYGFGTATLRASYVRYFLPIYVLMLPMVGMFIIRMKAKNRFLVLYLIILITMTSTLGNVITEMDNVNQWLSQMKDSSDKILESTPKNALVVTLDTRLIFPYRKVAAYDPLLLSPEEVSNKMIKLYESDIPVYLFANKNTYKNITDALENKGYIANPMEINFSNKQLYLISRT